MSFSQGSRVEYRLLVSGSPEAVTAYEEWLTPLLGQGQRLDTIEGAQPRIGNTLDRAQGFLLLAGRPRRRVGGGSDYARESPVR
ncbi:MAG: hypothetical protein CM15mP74_10140 [Halieaceae bacterium]|nr:MAG: hypothetical protein CM15mP74_10140 [Halieaceae bacterium]